MKYLASCRVLKRLHFALGPLNTTLPVAVPLMSEMDLDHIGKSFAERTPNTG